MLAQQTFTCSKLAIETLEKDINMFKVNNKDKRTKLDVTLVSLLLTLSIFHKFFLCFIVKFEQVNVCRGELSVKARSQIEIRFIKLPWY